MEDHNRKSLDEILKATDAFLKANNLTEADFLHDDALMADVQVALSNVEKTTEWNSFIGLLSAYRNARKVPESISPEQDFIFHQIQAYLRLANTRDSAKPLVNHQKCLIRLDIASLVLQPSLILLYNSGIEYNISMGPLGGQGWVEGLLLPFPWAEYQHPDGHSFESLLYEISGDEHHLDQTHADALDALFAKDPFTSMAKTYRPLIYESWAHCVYLLLEPKENLYQASVAQSFGSRIAAILTW